MITRLRTPLDRPIALFLVSALIGVWASYDPATSWRKFAMIVAAVVLYYLVIALRAVPDLLETVVWLFLFGFCALMLYFVTQHDYAAQPGKFGFITVIGLSLNRITPQLGLHVFDANITSGALEIGLPLAVALAASRKEKGKRDNGLSLSPGLLVSLSVCAIISFGLVMTSSRGAWLSLGIVGGIAVLTVLGKDVLRRYALPVSAIVVLTAVTLLLRLGDTFVPTLESILGTIPAGDTAVSRVELWGQAQGLIQDYYFTGSGLGVFPMILSTYALLIDVPFLTHAHNLFLQIWLEQGLLGIVALVWLVVAFYFWAWNHRYSSDWLAWGGIAAVTVMLLHGMVDVLLYSSRGLPLMFIPMAAAIASEQAPVRGAVRNISSPRHLVVFGLLGSFVIIVLMNWQSLAATWYANLGCVEQTRTELSQYHWPDRTVEGIRKDPKLTSNFQSAIIYFQRALELDAGNVTAHQRLAAIYLAQGSYGDAQVLLRQAYLRDPSNRVTNRLIGLVTKR